VEVSEINTEKNRVRLKTWCVNQDNVKILEGDAMASPPKK
jgi:3-hydroxybutyryl-CoA dehydratase